MPNKKNHSNSAERPLSLKVVDTKDPSWLLAQSQTRLKAYILSLLSNTSDADDILQETNTYILTHLEKFEQGSNFKAWAFQIAFFRVKSYIRDRQRRGHVELTSNLIDQISHAAGEYFSHDDERLSHLHRCIQKLSTKERLLVRLQYIEKASVTALASRTNQTANSLHKALSRIRQSLRLCVEQQSKKIS